MSASFNGATIEWEGDLDELTEVTVRRPGTDPVTMPLESLIAMTNGEVLASLPDMV